MEKSKVYFTDTRTSPQTNLLDKLEKVIKKADIKCIDFNKKFVAIKIHFGEPGNLAYIRPNYVSRVVGILKSMGALPYLTDCNTLYSGRRSDAINHLQSASENGFNPLSASAHVIIADGIKGTDFREISINGEYFKTARIGTAIADSDIIVTMTHFKGHEQAGFGGVLKNIGMGSASVGGKLELHSASKPVIDRKNCTGCRICVKNCAHDSIHLDEDKKAFIDYEKCTGCGQCVAVCQYESAVVADWGDSVVLNKKIAEYSYAVLKDKPSFHISFIMNVSPNCDCWGSNDAPLVADIGIAASFDPVALDMACADLVNNAPAISGSAIFDKGDNLPCRGEDKFKIVHPNTDWRAGLEYAQKLGIGNTDYELFTI
ncbi:MAG: DUF362 domain-containing protein [Bacteroidales bacterium]|nr:DUF362 domain-containing protein [Bacteroidales bacterium]